MPRDLLRIARAAVAHVTPDEPRTLAEVTHDLIERELTRIAGSANDHAPGTGDLLQLFRSDLVAGHGGLRHLGERLTHYTSPDSGNAAVATTLSNRAYYLDTLELIFTANLTKDQVIAGSRPHSPQSFSILARTQREIGTTDTLAKASLQQIRKAWTIPPLRAIS